MRDGAAACGPAKTGQNEEHTRLRPSEQRLAVTITHGSAVAASGLAIRNWCKSVQRKGARAWSSVGGAQRRRGRSHLGTLLRERAPVEVTMASCESNTRARIRDKGCMATALGSVDFVENVAGDEGARSDKPCKESRPYEAVGEDSRETKRSHWCQFAINEALLIRSGEAE
eukprot:1368438-Pleurochrysis_carterae.AAC.1